MACEYIQEVSPLQDTSTAYPIKQRLYAGKSQFAEIDIVTSDEYGRMLFLDKELQSASNDEKIYHETLVHPIINHMVALDHTRMRVLVIGGAEGATVREVLKWGSDKVSWVDWVDIDTSLVELCRKHLKYADDTVYADARVRYYADDIMNYLDKSPSIGAYDVIIIDLPDPDPEDAYGLYTDKFWGLITRALAPEGRLVTHCGPVVPGRMGEGSGMEIVRQGLAKQHQDMRPYHTLIPSFQGEWGFLMTATPEKLPTVLTDKCDIMNEAYQRTIFHWDKHWGLTLRNFS